MTLTIPSSGQWAGPMFSIDTFASHWMSYQTVASSAAAWGTANRAIYVPVRVPKRCVVRELGIGSGATATGNVDVGIYDPSGVRLVSSGSTAKTATSIQAVDVTDTTIGPGLYYLGLNNDTTTDTFVAFTSAAPLAVTRGVLTEALGSVTLPATATWVFDHTLAFMPLISALLVTEVS